MKAQHSAFNDHSQTMEGAFPLFLRNLIVPPVGQIDRRGQVSDAAGA